MRIGWLVPGGLGRITGGTIYDRQLVVGLRGLGVRVDELPLRARSGYARAVLDNLEAWPGGAWDVLIEDELGHPALFARNARAPGPVVALVHNLRSAGREARDVGASLARAIEQRYLRDVAGIVAVCDATLTDVHALLGEGTPAPPTLVLRAGRDHAPSIAAAELQRRVRGPGDRRPLRLLAVAAVAPHKGLHRLAEMLHALDDAPVTLEVAGSLDVAPDYARALVAHADARVRFLGQLRGQALWDAYLRADVAVLPSDREAYPLSCIEAMGFGLPVLVTNRGGAGELVTDGHDGFLLAPDDTRAWRDALRALALDDSRRHALARAALARHGRLGTWHDAAVTLTAFLETLRPPARGGAHPPGE